MNHAQPGPPPGGTDDALAFADGDRAAAWQAMSEEYARGFADGEKARRDGREGALSDAPTFDPWWAVYGRGYLDGWITAGYETTRGDATPATAADGDGRA